jgi:hypothetical protein
MNRCYDFSCIGSSGALHVTWPLKICWHNCSDAIHQAVRRIIRCWRTLRQNFIVCIFKSVGWTAAPPSVHPVLKLQSWRVSVLIQMKRRIDRRCPHSDRRIIRCYYLRCSSSTIHPAHLETWPSDHQMVSSSFCLLRSVPTTTTLCTDGTDGSSDGIFSFSFLSRFDPWKIDYLLNLACGIFASMGPRNVYKDMLNNMVSPIDHVVMNHQN